MKPQIFFSPNADPEARLKLAVLDETVEVDVPDLQFGTALLITTNAEILLSFDLDRRLQRGGCMTLDGSCLVASLPEDDEAEWLAGVGGRFRHQWEIDAVRSRGLTGPLPPSLIGSVAAPLQVATRLKVKCAQEAGASTLILQRGEVQLLHLFDS